MTMKIKLPLIMTAFLLSMALFACTGEPANPIDSEPPHEHNFEVSEVMKENNLFEAGLAKYACAGCGETEERELPKLTLEDLCMPILNLTGDLEGISKEDEVIVEFAYKNGEESYNGFATLKHQGSSSLAYPKKNFTIKLYSDSDLDEKYKIDFGFGAQSKYCLKANYIDVTQARNVVSAKIFADIVDTRNNIDENLKSAPNNGVIDGYPIVLCLDGEFHGVYTLNIPKDEWMLGMENFEGSQALLMADQWSDSIAFRKVITDVGGDGWDIEYCSTDDEDWVAASMNRLIDFIMKNEGEVFREGIGEYLDVDAAIDAMLFTYYLDASDNTAKNTLYATFDGTKWIPTMYDMDSTLGLNFDGTLKELGDTATLPTVDNEGQINLKTNNLLYKRLFECFTDEVIARYRELRQNVMSDENVMAKFEEFTNKIHTAAYASDKFIWELPSEETNTLSHMTEYIAAHSAALDEFFNTISGFESVSVIN